MTMTTKELLALVGKWRQEAVKHPHSALHAYNNCADELAPIATALCAQVEALRKDAERMREALTTGRDYVACALDAERHSFVGYEHCSDIESIESDLAQIDAAMNERANEPAYPAGDLRNLFGALSTFDTERQRVRRVEELNEKIRKVGTRCGDCDKWMKSRICPKEHNVNGYTRGPSSDGFICAQFVESASATNHRATLIAALNQEQGK